MMRRLEYGFGVWLDEKSCELVFENGVSCEVCKENRFGEMKHLAYEEDEAADGEVCYRFYQNIWDESKRKVFEDRQVTNGITILMPGLMGRECRKNSGHYHGVSEGHRLPFPEVYEVLCGTAVFLIQESEAFLEGGPLAVNRMRAAVLQEGEKMIIPPYSAHCVCNAGDGPMAFGNLAVPCALHYEPIARMHGFGMYLLKEKNHLLFVPNARYEKLPQLELVSPVEKENLGVVRDVSLNEMFWECPERFDYLAEPEAFETEIWEQLGK